jgi:hypothetical protein
MNATPRLHIEAHWTRRIAAAVGTSSAVRANVAITAVHIELGRALTRVLGSGPNFHTWAVWGSSKAGETIRGEGNRRAEWELPLAAAVAGGLAGLVIGWPVELVGVLVGWVVTRLLIAAGTRRAARLVLVGNKLVVADIGLVTAQYLGWFTFDRKYDADKLAEFLATLPDEQRLLKRAFACYHRARFEADAHERDRLMWEGNCLAVLHEHHKLQPLLAGAMPWGLRRYVTARLLKYRVGSLQLKVSAPLPPATFTSDQPAVVEHLVTTATRSTNWADLHDRMGYIFALFAAYHSHPAVASDTARVSAYNPRTHSPL